MLHIAQPCPESWAAMTPNSAGRHCAACRQTVVDFTLKTDAEIVAHLAQASRAGVCGRLRTDQVGRALVAGAGVPAPGHWRAWLGALLTAISLAPPGVVRAAGHAGQPVALVAPATGLAPTTDTQPVYNTLLPTTTYRVEGVVLDAKTNMPVPGATIAIQGTSGGVSTDENGKFVLPITPAQARLTLRISSVGYAFCKLEVDVRTTPKPLVIRLKAQEYLLGGLGFVRPPATLWQRVTRFFA
jgi:hypothetical protein